MNASLPTLSPPPLPAAEAPRPAPSGQDFRRPAWYRTTGKALRAAAEWFPLTLRAVLALLLLIGLFWLYGLGREDRILYALGLCGMGIIGLALALVMGMALWLWLRPEQGSETPWELEAGTPFPTGYSLGLVDWIPLLKFGLAWEHPHGAKGQLFSGRGKLLEEVTVNERIRTGKIVRRLTVTDVFGLARWTVRRTVAQPLIVKPGCGQVNRFPLVPQNVTGDQMGHPEGKPGGDLIEMRPYVPGDPLKLVLWKVYARTGRMLVRLPERAISPSERTLAYLVAGTGDEPAAGIARAVLENGSLGTDYLFGADGAEEPTRVVSEAVDQVIRSARARNKGGMGLDQFLVQGESRGIQACILFVPAQPGAWLDRVLAELARHPGPFRAVVGTDGLRAAAPGWSFQRFLFRKAAVEGSHPADVREVCERLQAAGAEVTVLNRLTGQVIAPTEVQPTSPPPL